MPEDVAELLQIDIERRTTRGRVCPQCGGKIVPSQRAVYENKAEPDVVPEDWLTSPLDVAFRLERDDWQGRTTIQARVASLAPHHRG